ncbi:MAG: alginate export family protein [Nitrospirota bacterium]
MRTKIKNIMIFFFSGLLLPAFYCSADAGAGDAGSVAGQEETRSYIRKLEQRVSDLEGIVKRLLDDKKAGSAVSSQQSTVPETAVEEKKDKTPSAAGKDEWDEPVVQKEPAKGRDEEARRRLTELETWKRKAEARAAKDAEETAERPKIEISGKYKLRLNSRSNLNLDNPLQFWQFDNKAYFDQRFQLKIDAEYGPLTSVLILDKGNFVFDWKEGSEGTLDRWSEFQTVTPALVRELYVQYTGNVIIKAGRHSLFVGNDGIVLEGPVDSLKVTYPVGQTPIGRVSATAAYIAVAGGWRSYNDFRYPSGDRSAVLGMANKLDGWLLSLDIKPKKDITIEPYLLKVFDRGRPGDPDLNLDKDFDANTLPRDGSFEPLWIGAAVSGKSNNISYKADLIYMTGAYTNTRDISAYAVMLRGDYKFRQLGPLEEFSAGLEFGRGSGNSAEERVSGTGDMKDFIGLFLCKERRKFGNIFSEDLSAGFFFADSNLSNVTFMRAIADFEPLKNLKTNISLSRFWTTESVYKGRGPVGDWSRGTSATLEKTRDIGWELDANFDFPIYKRLRGFVELGYFIPGYVYQKPDASKADPASEVVLGAEFEF